MTRQEELDIINRRIPEQEAYVKGLKYQREKNWKLVWSDVNQAAINSRRIEELLNSAAGVLENLKKRKEELENERSICNTAG